MHINDFVKIFPEVIMTPTKKGKATHIRIERKRKLNMSGTEEQRHHVAGGEHRGLVINKSSQGMIWCKKTWFTLVNSASDRNDAILNIVYYIIVRIHCVEMCLLPTIPFQQGVVGHHPCLIRTKLAKLFNL
jgi:hypothetical protein